MSILKAKSQSKLSKFMGVFLPPWIQQYLLLYSMAKGISKSEIIRNQIQLWVEKQPDSEDLLVQDIITKVQAQWEIEKTKGNTLQSYRMKLLQELKSKGVPANYIDTIALAIK
jgi:hypothetical protein